MHHKTIRYFAPHTLQGITSSLEAYYQQAGRAGRDGLPAHCTLMWTPQDFMVGTIGTSSYSKPARACFFAISEALA
jgi:hypothetical protein